MISEKRKSSTIRSYISAIKAILAEGQIQINEDRYLLNSLIHACKLMQDRVQIRLPVQKGLLMILLKTVEKYFTDQNQLYLTVLYTALLATVYYGLFCIGEVTQSEHVLKVTDMHIASNKSKLLFILHRLKTHTKGGKPQSITITSAANGIQTKEKSFCPFNLLKHYLSLRKNYRSSHEQFFIFRD